MKSTKKEAEGQIISVDAKKLAEGLKVTFEGVALVFSSLGMSSDIRSLDEAAEALGKDYKEPATKSVSKKKKEEKNDEIDEVSEVTSETSAGGSNEDSVCSDDKPDAVDACMSAGVDESEGEDESQKRMEDGKSPSPATREDITQDDIAQEDTAQGEITQDDITKIIVKKIKQDRKNNERIGQLLKTYGVSKVSELDKSVYEAFLTDISEL